MTSLIGSRGKYKTGARSERETKQKTTKDYRYKYHEPTESSYNDRPKMNQPGLNKHTTDHGDKKRGQNEKKKNNNPKTTEKPSLGGLHNGQVLQANSSALTRGP